MNVKKDETYHTVYVLQNRFVQSLHSSAFLNCDVSLFGDTISVGADENAEHHYWRLERPNFLDSDNTVDPNDQAVIDYEALVGGTTNKKEKVDQAIELLSKVCYVPNNIYEYAIIVYMDGVGYYHYTLPYTDGSSGSVGVRENKVPTGGIIYAVIHTHFGHHDNIIFNDLELPDEYDNYVIDDGGCVYYAEKGKYAYEITEPIVQGECYHE